MQGTQCFTAHFSGARVTNFFSASGLKHHEREEHPRQKHTGLKQRYRKECPARHDSRTDAAEESHLLQDALMTQP